MATKVKTELINKYRKENKLTVHQFCKKCNISQDVYYKFMNSQLSAVKISVLYNIAVTLNVLCDDILETDD